MPLKASGIKMGQEGSGRGELELLSMKSSQGISFSRSPFANGDRAFANIRCTFIYTAARACLTGRGGLQIVVSYLHFNNSSLLPRHSRSLYSMDRSRGRRGGSSSFLFPLFLSPATSRFHAYIKAASTRVQRNVQCEAKCVDGLQTRNHS